MTSDRGIHLLTILRKILDKLTYMDKYPELDMYMSDSNIGGRKKKNIINHLFIIHGVINNVIQSKDKCIDITIYDIIQAFDSLFLIDCLNDLYDTLPSSSRDDKLALIYETNVNNQPEWRGGNMLHHNVYYSNIFFIIGALKIFFKVVV